ncbi:facilitated trehalose transporter Tret1-like [Leptopilina boulardi]|uniref:facilitated trehalose transporter Tret1-like n=1 Tax=Leptopilina boulardi TaxID=63433 RepID=UPI0021F64FD3|nr:facilitated trehalose transporter Tret1-like [Leptopilina boulardi]
MKNKLLTKILARRRYQMQYIACISGSLATAACLVNTSWTSTAVPYLKSNESKIPLTNTQGAWIVSIYNIGDIIGTPLTILFVDRIGRKYTLLLYGIPAIISWLIIIFANTYIHLYIARLIAGIGHGFVFSTTVIYLAEISEKNSRITLFTIMRVTASTVGLIATTVGAFLSYEILNITCLVIPICFLIFFSFMPESPYYLLLKGYEEEAIKCLIKLRGKMEQTLTHEILEHDIAEMKLNIDESVKINAFWELLSDRNNRKAMLVVLFMKITQFMSGNLVILGYTVEIFQYSGATVKPNIAALILAGIRLISSMTAGVVLNFIDIKINFLFSGLFGAFCLFILGMYFYLKDLGEDVSPISWLPLTALIIFEIITNLGITIIPFIIQGELFPMKVKGIAGVYGTILGSICTFASTTGYSALNDAVGFHASFWLFGFASLFGSVITYFITPETTRKTLEEIQAMHNPEIKKKLELVRLRRLDSNISSIQN